MYTNLLDASSRLTNRLFSSAPRRQWPPPNPATTTRSAAANLCFALFVLAILVATLIAATYQPDDPLLNSSPLSSFLTSSSDSTFLSDPSLIRTGEDFLNKSDSSSSPPSEHAPDVIKIDDIKIDDIKIDDVPTDLATAVIAPSVSECDTGEPIKCAEPEILHLMMRHAIEKFPDIHFYRFGKPVDVPGLANACDLAWRFRPKDAKRSNLYKDYRRFHLVRMANCSVEVGSVDDYHSGVFARKRKRNRSKAVEKAEIGFEKKVDERVAEKVEALPVIGEAVNDTLPVIESESSFSSGRYLVYIGGGDKCKSMDHYLWSFLCALGEAQYLNRTFVMDLNICLNKMYTGTGKDVDWKDFRFYFDFEHLKDSASVVDQRQFWMDWTKWEKKDKLTNHFINDFKETPMKLTDVKDTLIMRKFGDVEPDNYWYRVCEGETESVVQRPWHLLWKSRRLMEIVSAISTRLNWDFDSVHIVRGEKAKNTEMWPNLASDTSPEVLLTTLRDKIEEGRRLYIATDEPDTSFFNPLKDKYSLFFLNDFKDLWNENSEWYAETKELNNGVPVEFDGYMKVEVDTEVFLKGKTQLETFNDLTSDCKDGINTCAAAS